jgi:hypothetical protein
MIASSTPYRAVIANLRLRGNLVVPLNVLGFDSHFIHSGNGIVSEVMFGR